MKNRDAEIGRLNKLADEKVDRQLFKFYKETIKDLKKEVKTYLDDYDKLSPSQRFSASRKQATIKSIERIMSELTNNTKQEMESFIAESAVNGYLSSMYQLEGQAQVAIDFITPNKKYIKRLVNQPVAGKTFSQRLYADRNQLSKVVTNELLSGAANGLGYRDIARNISENAESNYKQSLTIVRTEAGRVQSETAQKAYEDAQDLGIELQKQWISSGDSRSDHADADGQIVGIDEDFEVGGEFGQGPGMFGIAEQDINCTCTTITIVNGVAPSLRRGKDGVVDFDEWKNNKGM